MMRDAERGRGFFHLGIFEEVICATVGDIRKTIATAKPLTVQSMVLLAGVAFS